MTYNGLMTNRLKKGRSLFAGLLAAVACAFPALSEDAAAPGYHIEIIVFRANSGQGGAENWAT